MRKHQSSLFVLPVMLLVTALAPAAHAQSGTQTTVLTSPAGPEFSVDGATYFTAMSAFWPVGSVHTLSIPQGTGYSYDLKGQTQWQFQGWTWAGGSSGFPYVTVIADPSATRYTATFTQQFLLTLQVVCNPGPCTNGLPSAILLNGNIPDADIGLPSWSTWEPSGTTVSLSTSPGGGDWIFAGWQVGANPLITGTLFYSPTLNAPLTVSAVYVPAKPITLATNPPNLTLYADGTLATYNPYTITPLIEYWGLGTSHTLSGLNLTNDNSGKQWVFSSWSDGGAQTHTYVVPNNANPVTITCNYAPAASAYFISSPPNLDFVVDSQVLPPPYSYIWGVGSIHTVTATTPQTDAQGNTWVFQNWDDGVTTPTRTITIPVGADVNNFRMTAIYTQQSKLNVNSTIAGQAVTVNGSKCTTPCSLTLAAGAPVHVSAPASVPVGTGSRQDMLGWSNGSGAPVAGDWVGTLNTASTTLTATYHLMNSLSTTTSPTRGATWRLAPSSPDGYYDSQTKVAILVAPRPGFRFSKWTGDLSGTDPAASLNMNVPHNVTAMMAGAPFLSRGGVTNGAGSGEVLGVAPGSVASVYGENLSAQSATAPTSRLATTLAGTTVHIGPRTLPLYFVSPAQINFQIPADLPLGNHTLTVSSEGMPDVTSDFSVVRNAPGLFPVVLDGQTYAMATHEDGTAVSASAPARQGELLTIYGTGFGPTDRARPEAHLIPASPRFLLLDPVSIQLGSTIFSPESSFAAPGQAGVDAVQFRLDSSAPSGAAIPLYLTVNGVKSNTLALPIQ